MYICHSPCPGTSLLCYGTGRHAFPCSLNCSWKGTTLALSFISGLESLDWTGPQSIQSNFFFFIKPFFFLFYHRFPRKIGHIFYPECNYINEISIDSVAIISCNYCPLRPILFVVYEKFIRLPSQFYSPARLMVSTFFASLPKSTVLSGWVTCLLVI